MRLSFFVVAAAITFTFSIPASAITSEWTVKVLNGKTKEEKTYKPNFSSMDIPNLGKWKCKTTEVEKISDKNAEYENRSLVCNTSEGYIFVTTVVCSSSKYLLHDQERAFAVLGSRGDQGVTITLTCNVL